MQDEDLYSVAVQGYFYAEIERFLGISDEEVAENGGPSQLASSSHNVIKEYFENHDYIKPDGEQRLLIR